MGFIKIAILITFITLVVQLCKKPTLTVRTEGAVDAKFKAVEEALRCVSCTLRLVNKNEFREELRRWLGE